MKGISVTIVGLAAIMISCEPSPEVVPQWRGSEYFPLEVGAYSLYDVDSTAINLNVESSTTFQLRVTVAREFVNTAGIGTFVLQREKRNNEGDDWKPAGTWSAFADERRAVLVEGNARFIVLQFPIEESNQWNGNALNNLGGDDFCDDATCDVYSVSVVEPDVVVVQSDEPDVLVKYDVRKETYRKDVGLVEKETTVLEYCTGQDCFGKQFVDKGIRYKQTLVEYGKI